MIMHNGVRYIESRFITDERMVFYDGDRITHVCMIGEPLPLHIDFDSIASAPGTARRAVAASNLIVRVRKIARNLCGLAG